MIVGMKLDLPADATIVPVVRQQVDALLGHMSVAEEDVHRAGIVVTEACSNVVRHAYREPGNRCCVEVEYHVGRLALRITDCGRGFDRSAVPDPTPGQVGGYGMYFIRETADNVEVISGPEQGTVISAELGLSYRSHEDLSAAQALADPSVPDA